ncbi:glycosyltransferase family protein [Paenibacillus hexagrammi]|uniref:Glycosyltransferase n=1 Tax=Paenibacillus hexagrammi TaxID=2908839 RepID=A0ABY3SF99_9BACL|nr:hypothetical protein [Paenibacillus sp. YPD9-1]UJF32098.1 hypothetical protein L0M14_20520 [Paenibacillus sp. YPD9-1]
MKKPVNILLEGIFYNGHGLAEGNRILLGILDRAGYRVRIEARDASEKDLTLPARDVAYISSFENNRLPSNDVYLYNWVGSEARCRPEFRVNIARTTFETDRIPAGWTHELNQFDEVWVQSWFNLQTFSSSGVHVPLRHIPNFFDMHRFSPKGPKLSLPIPESFIFLSVFDLKKRKGYDALLQAYLQEFRYEDDIALLVKVRDEIAKERLEHYMSQLSVPSAGSRRPPVYIIDQMMGPEDIVKLYRSCHAFVLPTRGRAGGGPSSKLC